MCCKTSSPFSYSWTHACTHTYLMYTLTNLIMSEWIQTRGLTNTDQQTFNISLQFINKITSVKQTSTDQPFHSAHSVLQVSSVGRHLSSNSREEWVRHNKEQDQTDQSLSVSGGDFLLLTLSHLLMLMRNAGQEVLSFPFNPTHLPSNTLKI